MTTYTIAYSIPTNIATALSTELNSLANGAYSAVSAAIDNTTLRHLYMALELNLASLTPTAGGYIGVHLLPSVDASTYPDGGGAVAPSAGSLLCVMDLSTSAGAKIRTRAGLVIPPYLFKLVLLNAAGAALAASANTLKYQMYSEQSA